MAVTESGTAAPETVALISGAVMEIVGGVVSGESGMVSEQLALAPPFEPRHCQR
ncbi:MAG: hypothetical protein UU95_C0006G0002 [Parcubacteria group bacterium GW2011_GWC2_42_12]|nr:MAG: hypothetical protein UU95_C0006G0002 [Parcubacteria group bacterium GW2011_GWC2_42_12]